MKQIPGGNFKMARKIYDSPIWLKPPLFLKVWIFILGKANHTGAEKDGRTYKRGELITTYDQIIKGVSYIENKRRIFPTVKQIRVSLAWLESEKMILANPLQSLLSTGADPTAHTRAYVGIKIVIVNYDTYQTEGNYKGRHQGRPFSPQGHNNNNEEECINKYMSESDFNLFYRAYPKHEGRAPALKVWKKIIRDEGLFEKIMAAVENQKRSKWQGTEKKYIPLPATWLNQRRWEDEITEDAKPMTGKEALSCLSCGRRIVVKSDLREKGCVYCLSGVTDKTAEARA